MIRCLFYFKKRLPEPLATEVWESLFDCYYLGDDTNYKKLQSRYPSLRFAKP